MDLDDAPKALDELMQPGSTLMVGTGDIDLEFRPMTVARVCGDTIEMLLDSNEQWVRSLRDGDVAHVTMSRVVKPRGAPSVETPVFGPLVWLEGVGSFDVARSELSSAGVDGRLDLVGSACGRLLALHGGH